MSDREVWSGVVWDHGAEDEYRKLVIEWEERFPIVAAEPVARARAEQTARWYVELRLLDETISREVARAKLLFEAADKRHLHTEWLRTYGAALTESIVRAVKDPALCSPNLGRSL